MLIVRKRKYRFGKEAWYADFTVRGRRYRVALNASNKALATKEAQKLHDEILNKRYNLLDKVKEMTLIQLSKKYIEFAKENKRTWARDVVSLKNISNHCCPK